MSEGQIIPDFVRWLVVVLVAGYLLYGSLLAAPPEVTVEDVRDVPESVSGHTDDTGSSASNENQDVFTLWADIAGFTDSKWRHFVAYGALGYSLAFATARWNRPQWQRAGFVVVAGSLYGLGIETGQLFIPERSFQLSDLGANILGTLLVVPWYLFQYLSRRITS